MNQAINDERTCLGCGVVLEPIDGPTHRYMLSSPACWALYGEVLAREYSDVRFAKHHRLTVDAYAVQHPGRPNPQSIQSIALHLMSLCAVLEQGMAQHEATRMLQRQAQHKGRFTWLKPPQCRGQITAADVHAAASPEAHLNAVQAWAACAWSAWEAHHPTIRLWLKQGDH